MNFLFYFCLNNFNVRLQNQNLMKDTGTVSTEKMYHQYQAHTVKTHTTIFFHPRHNSKATQVSDHSSFSVLYSTVVITRAHTNIDNVSPSIDVTHNHQKFKCAI